MLGLSVKGMRHAAWGMRFRMRKAHIVFYAGSAGEARSADKTEFVAEGDT